jgi:hypothetical protein
VTTSIIRIRIRRIHLQPFHVHIRPRPAYPPRTRSSLHTQKDRRMPYRRKTEKKGEKKRIGKKREESSSSSATI